MDKKAKLIIVDDEPNTLTMYTLLLRREGYFVKEFLSAMEVLSYLHFNKEKTDLIIADLNMPRLDGLKLLEEVRKIPGFLSVPFIFLSASDDTRFHLQAFRKGAIDYIQKPVDNTLFLAKIDSILRSYRLYTLENNILLKGDEKKLNAEQLIAFCEEEKLTGFAFISYQEIHAVLTFQKGILEEIRTEFLTDSKAFDQIISWRKFRFIIIRGPYSSNLAKVIKEQLF